MAADRNGRGGVPAPAQEQGLIRRGTLDAAAREAYQRAYTPKCDTSRGLGSMEAGLDGAELYELVVGGVTVGRYALRLLARPNGKELHIVAAAGDLPGVDLVATMQPHLAAHGANADRMTLRTRRPGMVKKLQRAGWEIDCYVMGKKLR